MSLFTKYRTFIIVVLALIIIALVWMFGFSAPDNTPVVRSTPAVGTQFKSGNFSFSYPSGSDPKEYATGVVSVGGNTKSGGFISIVDVVRYKSDLQSTAPVSFDAYMKTQAASFCGSDSAKYVVTCTNPVVTPYKNGTGATAYQMSLTLSKKDTATGKTTTSTYSPIYVFNTTQPATAGEKTRYEGIFIYPTFSTFSLVGTTSPALVESIASSMVVTGS